MSAQIWPNAEFPAELSVAFKAYPKSLEQAEFLPLASLLHLADLITSGQITGTDAGASPELLAKLGLDAGELLASLSSVTEVSARFEEFLG